MIHFNLNSNRKKLVTVIVLALFLTISSSSVLGKDAPLSPNFDTLSLSLSNVRARLENFSLPKLSIKPKPQDLAEIPTFIPTQPYVPKPTYISDSSSATTNPVNPTIDLDRYLPSMANKQPTNLPGQTSTDPTKPTKPTKAPKPTKTPTPPPFNLTNPRPGKDFLDIAKIVGPIMCVPPAMVYAIYDNEAGPLGPQVLGNWTYYNTYPGSDPTDIPGSQQVFGVTQMMGDTWHRIKPYVSKKLGTTDLSLNVTFDSMAAAGYHVGNVSLAWKNKISCTDWPVDYIMYAACRYNGACPANTFGKKEYYNNYTYTVCASYNEYGGAQKKCQWNCHCKT